MTRHVMVVGGGIAGLAASVYLARGGCSVTVFEKQPYLGGRAVTHLHGGFRFNLGPHSVYRYGPGSRVYRELGIPVRGGVPKRGGTLLIDGAKHRLPVTPFSILRTSFLSWSGKLEAIRLLGRLAALNTRPFELITVRDWADRNIADVRLRELFLALCRVVTYSGDEHQSAAVALDQMKLAMLGVVYVDEGWQKIVDSLHSHAVSAGVHFVTSARVVRVDVGDRVRAIELGGLDPERQPEPGEVAARVPAETVLLAVDPGTAAALLSNAAIGAPWRSLQPITVSALDVALTRLPNPNEIFAIGIDKPYYFSVHSRWAQLTPHGGALLHVAKYRAAEADDSSRDEAELEALLDDLQPGWREVVVHKRFAAALPVANAMKSPTSYRPHPETSVRGLYIAGDWVGCEGVMADAALTSARSAAQAILAEA